jgi:hypothetical protein
MNAFLTALFSGVGLLLALLFAMVMLSMMRRMPANVEDYPRFRWWFV